MLSWGLSSLLPHWNMYSLLYLLSWKVLVYIVIGFVHVFARLQTFSQSLNVKFLNETLFLICFLLYFINQLIRSSDMWKELHFSQTWIYVGFLLVFFTFIVFFFSFRYLIEKKVISLWSCCHDDDHTFMTYMYVKNCLS